MSVDFPSCAYFNIYTRCYFKTMLFIFKKPEKDKKCFHFFLKEKIFMQSVRPRWLWGFSISTHYERNNRKKGLKSKKNRKRLG